MTLRTAILMICWICVIATGAWLRFENLGKRPFHADEATGARITANRLETGTLNFDPTHYHGPLLSGMAMPLCKLRGEDRWSALQKTTLRTIPALAGTLLLLVPLIGRRRFGDPAMCLAAAFLACSPLLVYYSRMFIHESLLVLFGMAVPFFLWKKSRWWIAGLLVGLMFATKETFAISVIAWSGAGLLLAWEKRAMIDRAAVSAAWRDCRAALFLAGLLAAFTAAFFYSGGFRNPQGVVDAVRTFFVYETVGGHDKPFGYYALFLLVPEKSGGVRWFETPLLLLALWAYAASFRNGVFATAARDGVRFFCHAAAGHFLIYSLIAYKTPWLACLPWAHVAVAAGFAVTGLAKRNMVIRVVIPLAVAGGLYSQFKVCRLANGRYASDFRNPYAYVPTRTDVEGLESWLLRFREVAPDGALEPVAVAGTDYWPLPWYLRSFSRIGYWPQPVDDMRHMPLVISMPEATGPLMPLLEDTHTGVPRGLRPEVPLHVFVRNDLWKLWMESDD